MILVVDDDHAIVQFLREVLEREGFEVRTAHDGAAAYPHLRDPRCKAVLLDMIMPGINGAALLMLMAAEKITVPVIVMSGAADYDEQELKQFPNVKKLLKKPFYAEDLLTVLREHVRK